MRISGARRGLGAVAPPAGAAALTLVLLTGWAGAGGAGRSRPVEVAQGWVLVGTGGAAATAAFFTVRNPGDVPDELVGASTAVSDRVVLSRHRHRGAGGRPAEADALEVPARGELAMAPMSADLVIPGAVRLTPGQRVEFTLRFRRSGEVRATAVAVAPQQLSALLARG